MNKSLHILDTTHNYSFSYNKCYHEDGIYCSMKKLFIYLFLLIITIGFSIQLDAQSVFWLEDFDDGGGGRWTLENAPGSGTNPTPAGIVGLTYEVNNPIFDNFVINDRNTPELSGNIVLGTVISSQGAYLRGRHYNCAAPSNLPNPFINTGGGPNQSLHITAHSACATLLYGGTPQSDDWNCISDPDNGDVQTKTEQIAFLNANIDATGKCNIKLTADFFLGGDADGIKSHSTILYSIDGGVIWKIVEDNLRSCTPFLAASCNNWHRRSFAIPSDADNQPDLRIAFRWRDDGDINNTGDYALGASFNVDNVMLSSCDKPNTDFRAVSGTNVCKGQTVILESIISVNQGAYINCFSTLTDNCTVSSYAWTITGPGSITYVDGTSSTDANPHVQLGANGNYTVELTATNCAGDSTITNTNFITVADCPPAAQFIASNNIACTTPTSKLDTIIFTDMSSTFAAPITAWSWTFTPATVTFVNATNATSQNPQVTFNAPGNYQISLQVITAEGTDTEIKTAFIEAISCECGGGVGGPGNLFFDDFTTGGGSWTLNSTDQGSTAGNENSWVVDANYLGVLFPSTPNRGGGNYMHIRSFTACFLLFGDCQAAFNATASGAKSFTKTPIINAAGATGVSISFWMLNASTGASGRAYVYYSTNGGTTWTLSTTYNSINAWTYQTITNAAFDNQANLRFGFLFDEGTTTTGVIDPPFSIDEVTVDAGSVATLPNTWEGNTNANWATATNWSDGVVPTAATDVLVPAPANLVGTFMPTISATATARNVCNFGTITLSGNNTLTIDVDLLNEGVITSTTTTNTGDVIFANVASIYRGSGTMYDIDVAVTSSDLTLETNLIARSLIISTTGTVDLATFQLSINKNLTKTAGTFTAVNGTINLIDPGCGACVDATSNANISMNAAQAFGNVFVNKTAGVITALISNVTHSFASPKTLTIKSGILNANTNTLSGTGNLTMSGGELQIAKCATVVPELTGNYALIAGRVTFNGVCNQITRVNLPGGLSPANTVFSEDFEAPVVADRNVIVGVIGAWTESNTNPHPEASFVNNDAMITSQAGGINMTTLDDNDVVDVVETLTSDVINFGVFTTNPSLTYDFDIQNVGVGSMLEVLYKSALGNAWTVGATHNILGSSGTNTIALAGASSTFYIGFRVSISPKTTGGGPSVGIVVGKVSFDNIGVTGQQTLSPNVTYYDVEYTGTSIKTLDNGNLKINNQLLLNLPTATGNYVDAGTDTVKMFNNNSAGVINRTGGHVVGELSRAITSNGGTYAFYVGSDNSDAETYYEPIFVTPTNISGATSIIANFNDASPNPGIVVPSIIFGFAPTTDTIQDVEDEGYWHLGTDVPVTGGSYRATVSPDINFWTFSKVWGSGQYTLLKQPSITNPWDYTAGGSRIDDSTTTNFSDFSNFALGFAKNNPLPPPLPVELIGYDGVCNSGTVLLSWVTATEINSEKFIIEKSNDGIEFTHFANIPASGNSNEIRHYNFEDTDTEGNGSYYRLMQKDFDGTTETLSTIFVECQKNIDDFKFEIYPNPTTGVLNATVFSKYKGVVDIIIYDLYGSMVYQGTINLANKGINLQSFNLKRLSNGTYIINARHQESFKNIRLVITH